jgi:hypothetical protein
MAEQTELNIKKLIAIPAVITLAVTLLRWWGFVDTCWLMNGKRRRSHRHLVARPGFRSLLRREAR